MADPTTQIVRTAIQKDVSRVAFRGYLASDQLNLSDGVWTKVGIDTIDYDLGGNYDTTNKKFTVPVSGLYLLRGKVDFSNDVANKSYAVGIYVNGILTLHYYAHTGAATDEIDAQVGGHLFLKQNDYVELYALSNAGVSTVDVGGGNHHTILLCILDTKEGIRQ